MSVIWSGVTAEGTVVPVQVTAEGKVVAVGDGPEGDYLKLTGGNLTGDLTLGTDKITLDASAGSATFAGTINGVTVGLGGGSVANNIALGPATLYSNTTGGENIAVGQYALADNRDGSFNTAVGQSAGYYLQGSNNTVLGAYEGNAAEQTLSDTVIISAGKTERMRIDSNGIATFSGDVVVRSRSKQWMLVEQGGLCHMVQQVKATTADLVDPDLVDPDLVDPAAAEYPKLRDVFSELNVIEKALEEVMEKLRMTEPDGWPVWDGSDNA